MNTKSNPINGNNTSFDQGSAEAALNEFYKAFNERKLESMRNNWINSSECSMSNPLGGIKRGWNEIKQVYEKICNGPATVYVEFYDYSIHQAGDMFIAAGREQGKLTIGTTELDLAIRTSRIFQRCDNSWQQLHHHGSMDSPALLKRYQDMVLGQ